MKRSPYSPEQAPFILRRAQEGTQVSEVCRKMGISERTFYRWRKKFPGMGVVEVRRLQGWGGGKSWSSTTLPR